MNQEDSISGPEDKVEHLGHSSKPMGLIGAWSGTASYSNGKYWPPRSGCPSAEMILKDKEIVITTK